MNERAPIFPLGSATTRTCFACTARAVVVALVPALSVPACADHGRHAQDKATPLRARY